MPKVTEAEWAVLEFLWQGDVFLLGEVYAALQKSTQWSRNTLHTYLTRMEKKGLVRIARESEPHRYGAAVSHADCEQEERAAFVQKVYGGSTGALLTAFLRDSKISTEERARLRRLLDEMET